MYRYVYEVHAINLEILYKCGTVTPHIWVTVPPVMQHGFAVSENYVHDADQS